MIAAIYARKSTDQSNVADDQKCYLSLRVFGCFPTVKPNAGFSSLITADLRSAKPYDVDSFQTYFSNERVRLPDL